MTEDEKREAYSTDIRRNTFIEVDSFLERKPGQNADGDVFLSKKNQTGGRIVTALSDGLGSGIKANILASLTATMLIEFVLKDIPPRYAAELIVNSLPVCRTRGISYATFTLVDVRHDMTVHFIEYDNPPLIIARENRLVELPKTKIPIERKHKHTGSDDEALFYSTYVACPGDRIVFFSDGVTQAGIGKGFYGDGWGIELAREHTLAELERRPLMSARDLAQSIVKAALNADNGAAHDDISCGVVSFREPRDLLVITGPPFHEEDDREIARIFAAFTGTKVILGGTTAKIIARELGKTLRDPLDYAESPAVQVMDGADLVCEGVLTLGAAEANLTGNTWQNVALQNPDSPNSFSRAASRFVRHLLNSDRVTFIVGTKLNEAHQDPTMPVELESRRSLIKRIAALLEEKYLKQTSVRYV
ncbi:MAG: serine/threonine-protein phosphatase [Spirochaetaceae bacterium]|jgi:hypothetical protein|nr:serine/threonine-protein phosphatase [Spirochaetaceae bacterium]